MNDPTVGAIDHPVPAPREVVRSEERLRVDTRTEITGRVRISKRVVTEERVVTVTIRREELVVEQLPRDADPQQDDSLVTQRPLDALDVARADTLPAFTLMLSEEEVEVSTRVVPRERVHVFIDTVTDSADVSENVAKEVINIDSSSTQQQQ